MITTLKELKLQTSDLTDFSKINLLDIHITLIIHLPQEQKNQLFITKARLVHGDKYDYSKVIYINSYTKVEIICPVHGSFWQRPVGHLLGDGGCPECASIKNKYINPSFSVNKVNEKIKEIHGDKFTCLEFVTVCIPSCMITT